MRVCLYACVSMGMCARACVFAIARVCECVCLCVSVPGISVCYKTLHLSCPPE